MVEIEDGAVEVQERMDIFQTKRIKTFLCNETDLVLLFR
jgi:hypothetical protein